MMLRAGRESFDVSSELMMRRAYVGGEWIDAEERIDVLDPATLKSLGSVPRLSRETARLAIDKAQAAFGHWRNLVPRQRADILMSWRALMLENRQALGVLMTREQGKPLSDAISEIEYGAEFVRWFAEECNRHYGDVIPSHLPDAKLFTQREPLGVVGLITPWNFPSAMISRKAAAALAAGCAAVVSPSMETPFSALALAALAERAGVPPGVFSVLTGDPEEIVDELCLNPAVRGVSFTGSTRVGRLIAAKCAPQIKRVSLELGGHAPGIVFADADIEQAATAAVAAKFQTSGQDCLALNRLFVHRRIYSAFVEAFVAQAQGLKAGVGFDEGVALGPLINKAALAKASAHVEDAVRNGAVVALGGAPETENGLFFSPTVLTDVTSSMRIAHEETFGPVAAIIPFDDEDAVVAAANDTEYGLVAYVFTQNLSRAHRLADRLQYGMVAVNTARLTGAPIPFGGIKQSGLGREGSRHGLDEYTEIKYICVAI